MIKEYISLTKPGIIWGNLITAIGGFLLASKSGFSPLLFFSAIFGLALIIASGCVFNNDQDREIDQKMQRTKNRPLVKETISLSQARLFGWGLLGLGMILLGRLTNWVALSVALFGFIVYVWIYTPMKKRSRHGTLIGSFAGATPPVVGYCAVTGRLDLGAFLLFTIVAFWQMPHFYAIALYRLEEYVEAGIPVHPQVKGVHATKLQMILYTTLFACFVLSPAFYGYTGKIYLVFSLILGGSWLVLALKGLNAKDDVKWARQMFFFSLLIILAVSFLLAIDRAA